jgi:hypothetical protein
MTREDVFEKYPRGYVEATMEEWMDIFRALDGQMMSPGGVAGRYGITRQAVLYAAKAGKIYYFTVTKPRRERGFVLISMEGLDDAFQKKAS